ncbi:hypothetical protein NPIL_374031 [Nephila pilipes]|uniref:Uncharacterized protein n=1 Tax=Nephila pilipes TaxID=299642 RepID=A0A8X6P108_NEPPI|nr:hypothetical protein NPIL_374031 [Nephila pilipes]
MHIFAFVASRVELDKRTYASDSYARLVDAALELQEEIELLKLEQVDVTRRGNAVLGELDDRRKLVADEYKLLLNKYENMLKKFGNNRKELSNYNCQI